MRLRFTLWFGTSKARIGVYTEPGAPIAVFFVRGDQMPTNLPPSSPPAQLGDDPIEGVGDPVDVRLIWNQRGTLPLHTVVTPARRRTCCTAHFRGTLLPRLERHDDLLASLQVLELDHAVGVPGF